MGLGMQSPRTVQAVSVGQLGSPCVLTIEEGEDTGNWDDCPDGYQCSTTCVPLRKLAETCDEYTSCDDALTLLGPGNLRRAQDYRRRPLSGRRLHLGRGPRARYLGDARRIKFLWLTTT